jgi:crotonobetainyl-CoA:carnitine CoA-transferase CaiB-like acyl-CoA transferase
MIQPLHGIRVVDLSQNLAGPYCTMILADLGADVLKVEPPAGDPARAWGPPFAAGVSPLFLCANRNKQLQVLDLKSEGGRAELEGMVARADVLVHAFRAGVAERLGLASASLRERHPRLVICSLSAYGADGPLAHLPGFDPLMQAHAGIMSVTGQSGTPVRVGTSLVDMGAGMWCAIGVLAALAERSRTGQGCTVETSLFEAALAWNAYHITGYLASGQVPGPHGTAFPSICPYEAFATQDGQLMIAAANDRLFGMLCDVLGLSALAEDERFRTNPDRVRNRTELVQMVTEATSSRPTEELRSVLERAGVPSAPVLSIDQVVRERQTEAVGMLRQVSDDSAGGYWDVALPLRWDGERPPLRRGAP